MTRGQQQYMAASLRGHILDHQLPHPDTFTQKFCATCGAPVLTRCPSCNQPLYGSTTPSIMVTRSASSSRSFCQSCGEALPWATRQQRIEKLRDLLEIEHLDDATALMAYEQIALLAQPIDEATEQDQAAAAERLKKVAPHFVDMAKPILTGLLTEAVKQRLGW